MKYLVYYMRGSQEVGKIVNASSISFTGGLITFLGNYNEVLLVIPVTSLIEISSKEASGLENLC